MLIRPATDNDVDQVMDLANDLYSEDGIVPFIRERAAAALLQLLADKSIGCAWVVETDGQVIGYLVLTWGFSLEFHGYDAFVDEVFIAQPHRGCGLGSQLLQVAEATCRRKGALALHLAVERSNLCAREIYRRRGFVEHDRYLMTKRLANPD